MAERGEGTQDAASGGSRAERLAKVFQGYVDRLCAGEAIDKSEVRALHPDLADDLLADLETLEGLGAERPAAAALASIGGHRVIREIGRGGMGVVYEAWDEKLERQVALKVLPARLLGEARAVARFVSEAKIAARLHHPGIVAIYGMGVDAGSPYIAMEYVEGMTLARALAEHSGGAADPLSPEHERSLASLTRLLGSAGALERKTAASEGAAAAAGSEPAERQTEAPVDLAYCVGLAHAFAEVADALSHAHSRGVIHRDLKPSNLMLEGAGRDGAAWSGRLRILDFGLARQEGLESLTASGDLIGTVLYMSPEQAASQRAGIDARTDIYSLGATLYEALAFRPPHTGRDHRQILSSILFTEPERLRRRNPRIPRDLETIVFKCLAKDPRDRYATAEALAQDLRRAARGDAIEARPLSPLERLWRTARRKRGATVAAVAIALLLVASSILLKGQLDDRRAARAAAYERQVIDAVLLLELGRSSPPPRAHTISSPPAAASPGGLLTGVAMAMEDEGAALGEDPAREALAILERAMALLPERPEAVFHAARALEKLGRRQQAIETARPILRRGRAFAPAVIWCSARGLESPEAEPRSGWEKSYLEAQAAVKEGRWQEAEAAYTALLEQLAAGDPYLGAALEARLGRGIARLELDRFDEAAEDFAAAQVLAPPGSLEPALLLGKAYLERDRPAVAEERFRQVLRAAASHDGAVERVVSLLLDYHQLERALEWARLLEAPARRKASEAHCLVRQGQTTDARRAAEEAAALAPDDPRAQRTLGYVLARAGEVEKAVAAYRESLRLAPDEVDVWLELADTLDDYLYQYEAALEALAEARRRSPESTSALHQTAYVEHKLGRRDDATQHIEAARKLAPRSVAVHNTWGLMLANEGRSDEALEAFRQAAELDPRAAAPLANLGWMHNVKKQRREGEEALKKALAIDPSAEAPRLVLGASYVHQGRFAEAVKELEAFSAMKPRAEEGWFYLGVAYEKAEQLEKAIEVYRRAMESIPKHPRAAYNLGNLHLGAQRYAEAIAAFEEAIALRPDHADAHNNIAIAYIETERFDEAATHLARALELDPGSPEGHWNLAAVLARQGKLAEAIGRQRQGMERAPGDPRPLGQLAEWLEEAGDLEGAARTRLDELAAYAAAGGETAGLTAPAQAALSHLEKLAGAARHPGATLGPTRLAELAAEARQRLPRGPDGGLAAAAAAIDAGLDKVLREP
jgi:serine/threonine protein kinase/tetratricopeptide (TPR) repeat protein